MISLDEAMQRVLSATHPLASQSMPLDEAAGHYLAAAVQAKTAQPRFDASAMDGYAVRTEDAVPGASLEVIGEAQAGAGFSGELVPGQAVRIFTGAPVPKGADAVIMQEQAERDGTHVRFADPAAQGQNIRATGRDFSQGQILLEAGSSLTPAALMLAAAGNNDYVNAFPKPVLGLLATGDELVPPGADLGRDAIVSSNTPGLRALFSPFCQEIEDFGIAPDTEDELRETLKSMLQSGADVIVTTGGASVGDHDLVQPVLKSLGVEMDFWKIAIRPGKPLMFGTFGKTLVFGLPGNPVSAMVTALTVVLPALRLLAGCPEPRQKPVMLPLAEPLPANGPRRHFLRASVGPDSAGQLLASAFMETDSAHLSSLAAANALIVQAENAPPIEAGTLVPVLMMPQASINTAR